MKAVIFDFGGVLVRTRSQRLRTDWEERLGLTPGDLSVLVFSGERGAAAQHGHITDEAHWQWIGEQLGLSSGDVAKLKVDFFADDVLDSELIMYIDRLRQAGLHLGLLSNASDGARQIFRDRYEILPHFDSVTISGEEGVMKPDPRIFEIALERAGALPEESVFVDDFAANVEGARLAGMSAVHFRTTEQAIAELAALTGVL